MLQKEFIDLELHWTHLTLVVTVVLVSGQRNMSVHRFNNSKHVTVTASKGSSQSIRCKTNLTKIFYGKMYKISLSLRN